MSVGGGGSGGSGTQKYEWNDSLKPYWENSLSAGKDLATNPYNQYGGDRLAPFTTDQQIAMNAYRDLAMQPGPVYQANQASLHSFVNGSGVFLPGQVDANGNAIPRNVNPWSEATVTAAGGDGRTNPYSSQQTNTQAFNNPYLGAFTGQNDYAGMNNPYFNQSLQTGMNNITNAYNLGAGADVRRMFNMSNAFGGSAHLAALNNAQNTLGSQLSNYANQALSGQYDRSANLQESALGRQQQDLARNLAGYQDAASQSLQAQQFDKSLGSQNFENWANRDLQAQQFNKQLGSNNWNTERGYQFQSIPLAMQWQQAEQNRYQPLLASGDAQQQLMQQALNQQYNDWQQAQMFPQTQLDWLTGLMSRSQGGMAPNVTSTSAGASINPISALLGGGALYGALKTPT